MKAKNKKILLIIIIVLIIILLVTGCLIFLYKNKKGKDKSDNTNFNRYDIVEKKAEVISNDKMMAEHCLDNICLDKLTINYNGDNGYAEYEIVNKTSSVASGYLKINFGDKNLIVRYSELEPGQRFKTTSQYIGEDFTKVTDYKLEKLTSEEESKIITQ